MFHPQIEINSFAGNVGKIWGAAGRWGVLGPVCSPPGRGGGVGGDTGVSAPDPKLILPMGDLVLGAWGAASPLQREQHPVSLGTQKTAITLQRGFL